MHDSRATPERSFDGFARVSLMELCYIWVEKIFVFVFVDYINICKIQLAVPPSPPPPPVFGHVFGFVGRPEKGEGCTEYPGLTCKIRRVEKYW